MKRMIKINSNYNNLQAGYLFSTIAKKISDIKESGFVMISTHDWYYSFGSRGLKKSFLNQVISKIHNYDPTKILKKI